MKRTGPSAVAEGGKSGEMCWVLHEKLNTGPLVRQLGEEVGAMRATPSSMGGCQVSGIRRNGGVVGVERGRYLPVPHEGRP